MEQKFCQSCGMPLTDDDKGTNTDGSRSEDYCGYCYRDGKFTQDMTMEEMIDYCARFADKINEHTGWNLTTEQVKEHMRQFFPRLKRWKNDSGEDMGEKAAEVLARCEEVTLASVNSDGFPRPVPMSIMKTIGFNEVWMSTGADSEKTVEFRTNPKAGLCYSSNGDSVVMRGTVEIVTDDDLRKEMWVDWMGKHFPGGPTDPSYVLLRFVGTDVTYWINGEFVRQQI